MKKIYSKSAVTNFIHLGVGITLIIIVFITGLFNFLKLAETHDFYLNIMGLLSVLSGIMIYVVIILAMANIQELIFEKKTITVYDYHHYLRFLPNRKRHYDWNDVIAWDETPVLTDFKGKDPFSIDLLIKDGEQLHLFRTPGSWITVDNKPIRFSDFKQRIKPLLDQTPNDSLLIADRSHDTTNFGYTLRYISIAVIVLSLPVMSSSAPSMAVMGFFVGLATLPVAEKFIKRGTKIRKGIAARQQAEK